MCGLLHCWCVHVAAELSKAKQHFLCRTCSNAKNHCCHCCNDMPNNMQMLVVAAGPSQCFAITVMQPPEGGKTLKTRPAYKGIIRAQLPSMCPLGALFRWLATRFAIEGEPLPTPGHPKWQSFLLWPGRAGGWLQRLSCALAPIAADTMTDVLWDSPARRECCLDNRAAESSPVTLSSLAVEQIYEPGQSACHLCCVW